MRLVSSISYARSLVSFLTSCRNGLIAPCLSRQTSSCSAHYFHSHRSLSRSRSLTISCHSCHPTRQCYFYLSYTIQRLGGGTSKFDMFGLYSTDSNWLKSQQPGSDAPFFVHGFGGCRVLSREGTGHISATCVLAHPLYPVHAVRPRGASWHSRIKAFCGGRRVPRTCSCCVVYSSHIWVSDGVRGAVDGNLLNTWLTLFLNALLRLKVIMLHYHICTERRSNGYTLALWSVMARLCEMVRSRNLMPWSSRHSPSDALQLGLSTFRRPLWDWANTFPGQITTRRNSEMDVVTSESRSFGRLWILILGR